ncbi:MULTISPECIES: GNAT family N-acetyltransferase [unclassified Mesobacillus]|uniref:GNAT family N-acetyltransferase n=1 Tax=unclassified Mesobacillus TaxID=2675270 RepID=UPI00203BBCBE|nr:MULTISPECIES: GNAT family N-acetyltransferase [unclassified Mesobacillus]MCM3125278.1 GNAT family N-acetyltransferase [Mesobacillus sp. MER 33]MCM3235291.1 GNAT family N-acetyltransferase [Mesobacillus sp. MER 48]
MIGKYEVKQINNLLDMKLDDLFAESKQEGFRFVERLINDYKNGSNTFSLAGEGLFGVFSEEGTLIAIGGLNQDPFSNGHKIGRLRRFYVRKAFRRHGIGSLLVKGIMDEASKHYKVLVLHTDTEQGDLFYRSIGFSKGERYPNSSHYIDCKPHQAQS